ncbi:MAG: adenosylcobinamide-GDP ribazoletransferase [Synergistaceae bacterium]|nr:adenosylcobinamide-GDP ribazoletransferase [Synergistaceae bacterium]
MLYKINSFLIALTFLSIFPAPQKFLPEWNEKNLRYFCVMIPVTGFLFATCWLGFFYALGLAEKISGTLRGFLMTFLTLSLTGGLHMDGLMDTCDAIFSRRDREMRLKILSDTHAGSFAVMGCALALMAKTFLFAEIFSQGIKINFFIPIYSRLGMAVILNNIKFAKSGGLAFITGAARKKSGNIFFLFLFFILSFANNSIIIPVIFILSLIIWTKICSKIFGGITGDLLGAYLEISEILFLTGTVIENCI